MSSAAAGGAFDEVVRGIERLREIAETKFTFVTTVSALNLDAMEPMARFARDLGVGISFNSVEPTLDFGLTNDGTSPNFQLGLTPDQLRTFYETLLRLKRERYPLLETETVLRDLVEGRPWKREFPKVFVYVSPGKKIHSCDYRYGYDLQTGSFEGYFSSRACREHSLAAESCNRCVRTCVRGYSYAYDLYLGNLMRLALECRDLFAQGARTRRASTGRPAGPEPSGPAPTTGGLLLRATTAAAPKEHQLGRPRNESTGRDAAPPASRRPPYLRPPSARPCRRPRRTASTLPLRRTPQPGRRGMRALATRELSAEMARVFESPFRP